MTQNNISRDSVSLKINVTDSNEDRIVVKVFLNDNKINNELSSDFFLPFIGKYRVMFGGIGDFIIVKSFISRCFPKIVIENDGFTHEKRNCECCVIF